MQILPLGVWLVFIATTVIGVGMASAQNFPSKPIRIVATEPGAGSDFAARLIAQGLSSGSLGQQVIVENRGGSVIAIETVAKALPDGYTLLFSNSSMWTLPLLQPVSYHPERDFSPVTSPGVTPNLLVVHPSLPVNSVQELITLAKAKSGELNYASGATGTSTHLAAELFKSMAGVNIVRVPYKATGPALSALAGAETQLGFGTPSAVAPHVKSARLRALAVTSAQPSTLAPDLPTVAASGLPGFEAGTIYGMFAPANTPAALIARLNQELLQVLNKPDIKQKFFIGGVETVGSSPQQLAATVRAEMSRLGKLIKDSGIRAN